MKYKKYPSYKDSGIDWLGEIPSEWFNTKLKYHSFIYNGNSISDNEKENYENLDINNSIPYVSTKDIDSNFLTINYDNGMRVPICNNKFKIAKKSSTLICIEGGSAGKKLALLNEKVCFVNKLACIDSYNGLDKRFSNYIVRSSIFNYLFNLATTGLIPGVSINQLKDFEIILPSIKEQQQIVNFLDKATAKIDTLIEKQTKQIELLKEKRQAVISHAVTKGINPNVPMKDSGVEWLGVIPEHWMISTLKFELENLNFRRIPISALERGDIQGKYPYYGASGVIDYVESYIFNEKTILIGEDGANLLSKSTPLAFIVDGKYWVNNHAHILKPKDKIFNFWAYILNNIDLKPVITGSAQPKLTAEALGNLSIVLPKSTDERKLIANYLDNKTSKIDTLIEKSNKSIELLKEKRTALISAAVTGKIDVREFE
ncbi:restriction endonuclease subunit S [Aliarcobacter cryaerophilus]|uniref:restriction endonuclease subunit S n=1 Tax=Aliarcobacter cryaerophilus TaxID=28198 RepID=UPI003DA27002